MGGLFLKTIIDWERRGWYCDSVWGIRWHYNTQECIENDSDAIDDVVCQRPPFTEKFGILATMLGLYVDIIFGKNNYFCFNLNVFSWL